MSPENNAENLGDFLRKVCIGSSATELLDSEVPEDIQGPSN
jgi:hypothetical protein